MRRDHKGTSMPRSRPSLHTRARICQNPFLTSRTKIVFGFFNQYVKEQPGPHAITAFSPGDNGGSLKAIIQHEWFGTGRPEKRISAPSRKGSCKYTRLLCGDISNIGIRFEQSGDTTLSVAGIEQVKLQLWNSWCLSFPFLTLNYSILT